MDHIIISINGTAVYESTRDTIHAIVVDGTTVYNPEFVPPPRTDNPFVAWRAANIDIWTVMTGQYLNRQLTEADWVLAIAAGYTRPEALQPSTNPGLTPDGFDPYRTSLTAEDFGKVFKAPAGRITHYSFPGTVQWRTVLDGQDHADAKCVVSLNGGPWFDARGAMGPIGNGATLDIDPNYEWSVQVGG